MQPKQIAKKIRKNLLAQKKRLTEYLDILNKEEEELLIEDPDKLLSYIDLEKNIIEELNSFKKIVDPLEAMYFSSPYKKDESLIDIKKCIDNLSSQVEVKSNENKERLEMLLVQIKADLKGFSKKNFVKATYKQVDSRLVDIKG